MSRKISEAHRPLFSIIAGLVSFAAVAACGAKADTGSGTSAAEQALTEAQGSYIDTKQAEEACFIAFEACDGAPGADVVGCKTKLHDCLPAQASPGPLCGGPPNGGPGGEPPKPDDCKGGPPSGGDPNKPGDPPPPPDKDPWAGAPGGKPPPPSGDGLGLPVKDGKNGGGGGPSGDHGGGPKGGPNGDGDGKDHPGFCKEVPLPASPALEACHEALHACLASGGDKQVCFEADRSCLKAAFDAPFQGLCAKKDAACSDPATPPGACDQITKLCADGIAPPAPAPSK